MDTTKPINIKNRTLHYLQLNKSQLNIKHSKHSKKQ